MAGWWNAVPVLDERVEIDHLEVVMEEGDCGIAGEAQGEGGDGCEDGSFGHG